MNILEMKSNKRTRDLEDSRRAADDDDQRSASGVEQKLPSNISFLPQRLQIKFLQQKTGEMGIAKSAARELSCSNEVSGCREEQSPSVGFANMSCSRERNILAPCLNAKENNDNLLKHKSRPEKPYIAKNITSKNPTVESKCDNEKMYTGQSPCKTSSHELWTPHPETTIHIVTDIMNNNNWPARPQWLLSSDYNIKHKVRSELIKSLNDLVKEMFEMVADGSFLKDWANYMQLRNFCQIVYTELILKDLKFWCQENVEQYFWKILYHNIVDIFKRLLSTPEDKALKTIKAKSLEVISTGIDFYTEIITLIGDKYDCKLDALLKQSFSNRKKKNSFEILAVVSIQKVLINLGDLYRYKEQLNHTQNFDCARKYYISAQKLMPTNGIPYNQLAILSIYGKKQLDAVYYHVRSLESSNPIKSAKESLKVIFDEIRKKHEQHGERELKNLKSNSQKIIQHQGNNRLRKEIWTHPDGSRRLHQMAYCEDDHTVEDNAVKFCPFELKKHFISHFLYIHGKLFTGIGMETFTSSAIQMLNNFRKLLIHSPLIFSKEWLMQIMALNIFSVDYNSRQDNGHVRKELLYQGLDVAMQMFGIILNRVNSMLKEAITNKSNIAEPVLKLSGSNFEQAYACSEKLNINATEIDIPDDVNILFHFVGIWCEWIKINTYLLDHLVKLETNDFYTGLDNAIDPWESFSHLLTTLLNAEGHKNMFTNASEHELYNLTLDENVFLSGFRPLEIALAKSQSSDYAENNQKNKTQAEVRLKKIVLFGSDFLCNCQPAIIKKMSSSAGMIFTKNSDLSENKIEYIEKKKQSYEKFEILNDTVDDIDNKLSSISFKNSNSVVGVSEASEINELLKRKHELEKKHKKQEDYHQKLKEILQSSETCLHMEVYPKYLVTDTNCFIDYLQELKVVSQSKNGFLLMVPLVVINELEGLSKGNKSTFDPKIVKFPPQPNNTEHFIKVSKQCQEALKFIKSKNSSIKCVTTKGSILSSSIFTLEDTDTDISNDDKILVTASNLCRNNFEEFKENILLIKTEVVLLTTDRNLRVKALSRNLSVSQLPKFLEWAGLKI